MAPAPLPRATEVLAAHSDIEAWLNTAQSYAERIHMMERLLTNLTTEILKRVVKVENRMDDTDTNIVEFSRGLSTARQRS